MDGETEKELERLDAEEDERAESLQSDREIESLREKVGRTITLDGSILDALKVQRFAERACVVCGCVSV